MENGKKIDAACIGYSEEVLPCERDIEDLGEWSSCTVVAHDLEVDEDGELVGTALFSFGPDYSSGRKVDPKVLEGMAGVVNDVIDRKSVEWLIDRDPCEGCDGCDYPDMDEEDASKLDGECVALIEELQALRNALGKLRKTK